MVLLRAAVFAVEQFCLKLTAKNTLSSFGVQLEGLATV